MPFPSETRSRLEVDAKEIIARYPRPRSAVMSLLHLVQSEEGYVSSDGIEFCAEQLDLTSAQVFAIATFYTMFKQRPVGEYHVGVCTNTLCAVLGGDAIFAALCEHLGLEHGETTEDGAITLEHIECNAACDYAPVIMVNWEFFDNQTPESATHLVDELRAGKSPLPTRGAPLCTFKQVGRMLAGFPDFRPEAVAAGGGGPATLAGLCLAKAHRNRIGATAPGPSTSAEPDSATATPSSHDAPAKTAKSDPATPIKRRS